VRFFPRLSFSDKLKYVILLVCAVALIGLSTGYIATEFFLYRKSLRDHVHMLTGILGTTVSAALVFGDPMTAGKLMASLESEPDVHFALLFDRDGKDFAYYDKEGTARTLLMASRPWIRKSLEEKTICFRFSLKQMDYVAPLFYEKDHIGHIYIRSGLTGMYAKFLRNAAIMSAMLLLSLFGAYWLSARLERRISGPILRLA